MQVRDFLLGLCLGAAFLMIPSLRARLRGNSAYIEDDQVWETLYQTYCQDNGPRVTVIGGGTGLSTLLRGLKQYSSNLVAIVNVTDDGGSSGRLRANLDMLPPGDIRNCLLALANTEPLLEKVFQYRFTSGDGLVGHNLGNLFLAALTEEFGFEEAVVAASRVLAVKGEVLPVTLAKLDLVAHFTDGRVVRGESRIPAEGGQIQRLYLDPENSVVYPAAAKAIGEAEVVLVGPGSLYTSILANLLVPGVVSAIRQSQARKVFICNVMTQPGETDGYTAADHLQTIYDHVGANLFDVVIINSNLNMPSHVLAKYTLDGAVPVAPDLERLQKMGVEVLSADLISLHEVVRHDQDKLARIILAEALTCRKSLKGKRRKRTWRTGRKEGAR